MAINPVRDQPVAFTNLEADRPVTTERAVCCIKQDEGCARRHGTDPGLHRRKGGGDVDKRYDPETCQRHKQQHDLPCAATRANDEHPARAPRVRETDDIPADGQQDEYGFRNGRRHGAAARGGPSRAASWGLSRSAPSGPMAPAAPYGQRTWDSIERGPQTSMK